MPFTSTQTTHARTHASNVPSFSVRSEFRFARQRLTPEVDSDIEMCRANLTARIARCHMSCDACGAECTSSSARSLVSAYRCSLGLPVIGMVASFHSSDVGVDVRNRWGSKRTEGRPAAPDDSFQEAYRTMVQNRIDTPIAPRNCESRTQTPSAQVAKLPLLTHFVSRFFRLQLCRAASLTGNHASAGTRHL